LISIVFSELTMLVLFRDALIRHWPIIGRLIIGA